MFLFHLYLGQVNVNDLITCASVNTGNNSSHLALRQRLKSFKDRDIPHLSGKVREGNIMLYHRFPISGVLVLNLTGGGIKHLPK